MYLHCRLLAEYCFEVSAMPFYVVHALNDIVITSYCGTATDYDNRS
jgi:hypothetical protein